MHKLVIDKVIGYNYHLKDENARVYDLNIEFYDLENPVKVGDSLYIYEELLKEKNMLLSFGPLNSEYGRKISSSSDKDIVVLISNDEELYLKRYYG